MLRFFFCSVYYTKLRAIAFLDIVHVVSCLTFAPFRFLFCECVHFSAVFLLYFTFPEVGIGGYVSEAIANSTVPSCIRVKGISYYVTPIHVNCFILIGNDLRDNNCKQ